MKCLFELVPLRLELELEVFDIEQTPLANLLAKQTGGKLYSWKTSGRWNWLEHGVSIVDTLGLVVLPVGLPETIDLPDDPVA